MGVLFALTMIKCFATSAHKSSSETLILFKHGFVGSPYQSEKHLALAVYRLAFPPYSLVFLPNSGCHPLSFLT